MSTTSSSSSSSSTHASPRQRRGVTVAVSSVSARSGFLGGGASHLTGAVLRGRRRRVGTIRPSAVGPNEVNELAGAALLTLSGFEAVLGKVSFGSLLTATSIYEYKVRRVRQRRPRDG